MAESGTDTTTNGNGSSPGSTKAKVFTEIGRTGLLQNAGVITEDILPVLQGDKAIKIYREMSDNDPVVGALLFGIDMLLRQISWEVEPNKTKKKKEKVVYRPEDPSKETEPDPDLPDAKFKPSGTPQFAPHTIENQVEEVEPEDQEYADFVTSCLHDMSTSWPETVSSILSMLPYGWSYHEIVYKLRKGGEPDDAGFSEHDDGKIGWKKFALRHQETRQKWEIDSLGGIDGMWQHVAGDPTFGEPRQIPITKAILTRTTNAKGNPEGRSVLRNAYRPWMFKKRIEEIEAVGIERDLAGLPVAWVPAQMLAEGASDAEKQAVEAIKTLVRNIRRDEQEGIVFPLAFDPETKQKVYDLTLLSTGSRRQFDTGAVITRLNQQIAMTVLADFILLGHEKVGSYALGGSKVELFQLALKAWADNIAEVFNRFAIPRLLKLNKMDLARCPKLRPKEIGKIDVSVLGGYLQQLFQAQILSGPDERLENWAREQVGAPVKEPGAGEPEQDPNAAAAQAMAMAQAQGPPGAPGQQGPGQPGAAPGPPGQSGGGKPGQGANGVGGNNGGAPPRGGNKRPMGAGQGLTK